VCPAPDGDGATSERRETATRLVTLNASRRQPRALSPGQHSMAPRIFEVETAPDTLVIVPVANLSELSHNELEQEAAEIIQQFETSNLRHVVIDFQQTDYFGSTALGFFVKLWKMVIHRQGRMALCGISKHEEDILKTTRLDQIWPLFTTRPDALQAVKGDASNDPD
jgi:anti-sigma B factor antagonist